MRKLGSSIISKLSLQKFDLAHSESYADYIESELMREGSLKEDLPYGFKDMVGEAKLSYSKENASILPPQVDMLPEEGFALLEWRS